MRLSMTNHSYAEWENATESMLKCPTMRIGYQDRQPCPIYVSKAEKFEGNINLLLVTSDAIDTTAQSTQGSKEGLHTG